MLNWDFMRIKLICRFTQNEIVLKTTAKPRFRSMVSTRFRSGIRLCKALVVVARGFDLVCAFATVRESDLVGAVEHRYFSFCLIHIHCFSFLLFRGIVRGKRKTNSRKLLSRPRRKKKVKKIWGHLRYHQSCKYRLLNYPNLATA